MGSPYVQSGRDMMRAASTPLHYWVQLLHTAVRSGLDYLEAQHTHLGTIENLSTELRDTQRRLFITDSLLAENARLRLLLNMPLRKNTERVVAARVYGNASAVGRNSISIDKGSNDGIFVGQVVTDGQGIIGQVVVVHSSHSEVLLVTDSSHATPIKVVRTGYTAIAQGRNQRGSLKVRFVARTADIKLGDVLVSSGMGGRFPADCPVAVVTDVDPGDKFLRVYAKPAAFADSGSIVLLLWPS